MAITTTTILPPAVQAHFDKALLAVPYGNLIHGIPAQYREMPAHAGDTWRGRRYDKLKTFQVPLGTSGIDPTPQVATALDIDAKIQWFATSVMLNQQVVISCQEPVLNEITRLLGLAMRETQDILLRDILMSSASVVNFTGGSNGNNPSNVAPSDFDRMIRMLLGNNAWTITKNIEGEDKFSTTTIRNSYIAMCHTDLSSDLDNMVGWKSKDSYANYDASLNSEWGAYRNIRFLLSTQGAVEGTNSSQVNPVVYDILMVGADAYGTIEQTLGNTRFWYRDPLIVSSVGLNSTIGVSFASAQAIYQDGWVLRGRCTTLNQFI